MVPPMHPIVAQGPNAISAFHQFPTAHPTTAPVHHAALHLSHPPIRGYQAAMYFTFPGSRSPLPRLAVGGNLLLSASSVAGLPGRCQYLRATHRAVEELTNRMS